MLVVTKNRKYYFMVPEGVRGLFLFISHHSALPVLSDTQEAPGGSGMVHRGNYTAMPISVNLGEPEPDHQTAETEAREKGGMDE